MPIRTTAIGAFLAVPDADPEMVPDSFSIAWQYDNFLMTFANGEVLRPSEHDIEGWGVFFVGNRGSLQVNRMGYAIRPVVPRTIRKQGGAAAADRGRRDARRRRHARLARPGAPAQGAGGGGGGRGRGGAGGESQPPVERKVYVNPRGGVEEDYPLDAHTRNFLDC